MGTHFKEREEGITLGVIILGIAIIALLVTSIVTYLVNPNRGKVEEPIVQEQTAKTVEDDDDEFETVSIEMGKTVEQASDELNKALNEANKVDTSAQNTEKNNAINTEKTTETSSKVTNKDDLNSQNKSTENTSKDNKKEESAKVEEQKEEPKTEVKFTSPLKGEIIREFAPDSLVYSETLQEWITHNGIDIKADKTAVVTSACQGTVSAIKNDPRYGLTVIIDHEDGYQTIYANLLTAEFVVQGEKVEPGQTIGTVGNSANFEIADEYHLHFEIKKDGEYVNPTNYIE